MRVREAVGSIRMALLDREANGENQRRLLGNDRHELVLAWSVIQFGLGVDACTDVGSQETNKAVGINLGPLWLGYHGWRPARALG